ncbi:MAG: 6-phosphogluconolactonase, partial [Spirochaetes bacterium]|nr:6-phosphogluconolactonase [Spirochaetota bacterium]
MVPGIQSYKNIEEFSEAAASLIIELAKEYIRKNGRFTFVLSGGNTPKTLYEHL